MELLEIVPMELLLIVQMELMEPLQLKIYYKFHQLLDQLEYLPHL